MMNFINKSLEDVHYESDSHDFSPEAQVSTSSKFKKSIRQRSMKDISSSFTAVVEEKKSSPEAIDKTT